MSTAKPPMVIIADVKKARPARLAAVSIASRGLSPRCRSSKYRPRISTENSVHDAMTRRPDTAASGLNDNPSSPTNSHEQRRHTEGRQDGNKRQQRTGRTTETKDVEDAGKHQRWVDEVGAICREVLKQAEVGAISVAPSIEMTLAIVLTSVVPNPVDSSS